MNRLLFFFLFVLSGNAWGETQFGLYLTGGSTGAETFRPFIKDANNGHIVVLKASEYAKDWYNKNIPKYGKVRSVTTLLIMSREEAMRPEVYQQIIEADGLFIAGGNQAKYHAYWKDSLVADAINRQLKSQTPVGGTSAGLAILGEYYFSAERGGISSDRARRNPYSPRITLRTDFLNAPFLKGIITDTHFAERERLGRLEVFMQRIFEDYQVQTRGLGVDEATTLIVREDGQACVNGEGQAHLVSEQIESYSSNECFSLK